MKLNKWLIVTILSVILSGLVIGYLSIANAADKIRDQSTGLDLDLDGSSWALVQINGQDAIRDSKATLIFAADQVRGNATCNRFFGPYETDGNRLSFGLLGSTMMACDNMDQEADYLAALALVKTYRVEDGQLVLSGVDQDAVLVFEPTLPASLTGTTWQLNRVNTGSALVSVLEGTRITATFSDGRVTGSAGCNSYFASFTVDGPQLSIGPAGSTEMFCAQPDGTMEQELDYLQALGSTKAFQIEENVLILFDADGERLFEFAVVEND